MTLCALLALIAVLSGALFKLYRYTPGLVKNVAGTHRIRVPVKFFKAAPSRQAPVTEKALLTGNELEFWGRLQAALPGCAVLPQVAMGALIQTKREGDWDTLKRFQSKICDFVLVDRKTGKVLAIVELDDVSHQHDQDFERDKLLSSAGIATLRFHSRAKPSKSEINSAFRLIL